MKRPGAKWWWPLSLGGLGAALAVALWMKPGPAPVAAPRGPIEVRGPRATQFQSSLEAQLESWRLLDGGVELQFGSVENLPRYFIDEEMNKPLRLIPLSVGQKFFRQDHHFRLTFTLLSADERQVELGYLFRGTFPTGPEHETGSFGLTSDLTQSGFQDHWRSCHVPKQCDVISTPCGGHAAVSQVGYARLFFSKLSSTMVCPADRTPEPAPLADCVDGRCVPFPQLPDAGLQGS